MFPEVGRGGNVRICRKEMLYRDKIAIKYAKLKGTVKLAEQDVPKCDRRYYKRLNYVYSF